MILPDLRLADFSRGAASRGGAAASRSSVFPGTPTATASKYGISEAGSRSGRTRRTVRRRDQRLRGSEIARRDQFGWLRARDLVEAAEVLDGQVPVTRSDDADLPEAAQSLLHGGLRDRG